MIRLENVTKYYPTSRGRHYVFRDITLELPDGVNIGTDVRLSGIKVGTVQKLALDPKSYNAVLTLALENYVKLPDDSSVRITSEGLLGNQYLSIEPGSSMQTIKPGGEIENTQGSIDLIGLLGKAVFSTGEGGSK